VSTARDVIADGFCPRPSTTAAPTFEHDHDGCRAAADTALAALRKKAFVVINPTDPEVIERAATAIQPTAGNHAYYCPTWLRYEPLSECTCGWRTKLVDRVRAVLAALGGDQ
jgi:hypothetical protein